MNEIRLLELLARDCYRVGSTWAAFWAEHGQRVRKAEPYDRARYHRLANRLMALVVSGDTDGQQAIGDDDATPWEIDDTVTPADVGTRARCLMPMLSIPGVTTADRLSRG